MKINGKTILIFLCAALFFIMVPVVLFDKKEKNLPKEVILAHDKGSLPIFQENFLKQSAFAKKNIGIAIKPTPSQTPELYIHQMKASLPTSQAPDLFTWWSTFRVKELVDNNFVGDLTDLWDKHKDDYSKGLREAFTIDHKVYGFPYSIEYWPVWYNKDIFKKLKLEKPETWTEFIQICKTLKSAGITPVLSSYQDKWTAFIWFEEMIIGENPDLYEDLCIGRVKYTDPRVKKAFLIWKEMINKGYFTDPSANMLTNAAFLWNNKKIGMVLCGSWYYSAVLLAQGVDEKTIGAFILPSHNKDAGKNIIFESGPIFTSKNGANADAAKKVADWWMGPQGNQHFASLQKAYPGNLKADTAFLPSVKKELLKTIKTENYRVINRYWEATPAPVAEKSVEKFGEFILNPDNLDQILKDLDTIADDYWSKNKK